MKKRHHLTTKNTGGHVKIEWGQRAEELIELRPRIGHSGSARPTFANDPTPIAHKWRCPECWEIKRGDERVLAGMKCWACAYGGETNE